MESSKMSAEQLFDNPVCFKKKKRSNTVRYGFLGIFIVVLAGLLAWLHVRLIVSFIREETQASSSQFHQFLVKNFVRKSSQKTTPTTLLRHGTYFQQEPQHNDANAFAITCGCPATCTDTALKSVLTNNGPSCENRIRFLMRKYGLSEEKACNGAVHHEQEQYCGVECDPNVPCRQSPEEEEEEEQLLVVDKPLGQRLRVLVMAAVPYNVDHAIALWTQLECFTGGIGLVVLAVPTWSEPIVTPLLERARNVLGLNIAVGYYENDRYDVGLWCDALGDLKTKLKMPGDSVEYESIVLVNDSVYAIRPFMGIQDQLAQEHGKLDLVSLSYSNMKGYWLESVMRGFHGASITRFINHACNRRKLKMCSRLLSKQKQKRCYVEHMEIQIASLFDRSRVKGLYPSDPPPPYEYKTWVRNDKYWREILVKEMDFPVAKVKEWKQVKGPDDMLLTTCTRQMDTKFIREYDYDALQASFTLKSRSNSTAEENDKKVDSENEHQEEHVQPSTEDIASNETHLSKQDTESVETSAKQGYKYSREETNNDTVETLRTSLLQKQAVHDNKKKKALQKKTTSRQTKHKTKHHVPHEGSTKKAKVSKHRGHDNDDNVDNKKQKKAHKKETTSRQTKNKTKHPEGSTEKANVSKHRSHNDNDDDVDSKKLTSKRKKTNPNKVQQAIPQKKKQNKGTTTRWTRFKKAKWEKRQKHA